MTREDCFAAMNTAFNAAVEAGTGSWDFKILSTPVKFVTMMPSFVKRAIEEDRMTVDEFLEILRYPDRRSWASLGDGVINLVLR
jgi:hypothetical protein